jgi:nucleoside-diphosphate-sugar epimerase
MIAHRYDAPQKPDRVVLLGARGFIGRAVSRELDAKAVPTLRLTSADVDLASSEAVVELCRTLQPTDAVVMLSALTPDKGRDVATMMKNLAMMQHLCAAIERMSCAHLVYFSSDAVYSPAVSRITEETSPSPQDLYGAMHHTRELMGRAIAKIPLLIVRPTLVYGVEDTHNAYGPNRFRRAAQKDGKIQLFGAGEDMRDHIHVDDVAALTVRCLLRRSTGTMNAATGRSVSFHEVARLVGEQFGEPPIKIERVPRTNPITHRHYDVTALIKAFPDVRFTSLEDGIARCHREATGGV